MIESNSQIRTPIPRSGRPECEEHGLENSSALLTAFEYIRCYVEAAYLQAKPVQHFGCATALPECREVLIEKGLTRPARIAALRVREQRPVSQLLRLIR